MSVGEEGRKEGRSVRVQRTEASLLEGLNLSAPLIYSYTRSWPIPDFSAIVYASAMSSREPRTRELPISLNVGAMYGTVVSLSIQVNEMFA
jgi:hypothetical protein